MTLTKNILYTGFDGSISFDLSTALPGVNLVGKTMLFTVKANRTAPDNTAVLEHDRVIQASDLDPNNALNLILSFTAAQMENVSENLYYFDLKLFNPDGTGLLYIPFQELQVYDAVTDRIAIS